jgi:outer membrane lipoprotein SlyB
MEEQAKKGLHPLIAGASVAVIIAAGVAVAAITGYLPGSKAEMAPESKPEAPQAQAPASHPAQIHRAAKPVEHRQQVAAACMDCGVVVDVKQTEVLGKGTGLGAVAGGVGGAVIGHEIGNNRAGTAVGAVVGAVAGHQIERKAREHPKYEISVRMNDGTVKSITDESGNPVTWKSGDKVRVGADGVIRPI